MNQRRENIQRLWAVVGGLGIMTVLGGSLLLLLGFVLTDPDAQALRGMAWGVGGILIFLGGGLIWSGLTGWQQTPSPRIYGGWPLVAMGALTLLIFTGGLILPTRAYGTPLFAWLLAAAVVSPALLWLAAVGWAAGHQATVTLRQMFIAIAGSIASIALAFVVQVLGLLGSSFFVAIVAAALPGGMAEVERIGRMFQQWAVAPPRMEEVLPILMSPVVLSVLILVVAVIAPLIEELGKVLIITVMGQVTRPSLARAFVWGVACGLGFAMVEGVTNSLGGITDISGLYASAGSRFMATGMHALTSGLVGLGLGLAWHRRWWALPILYLVAVIFHGLWNLALVIAIAGGASIMTGTPVGLLGVLLGGSIITALILLTPVGLIGIPLALRRHAGQMAD